MEGNVNPDFFHQVNEIYNREIAKYNPVVEAIREKARGEKAPSQQLSRADETKRKDEEDFIK